MKRSHAVLAFAFIVGLACAFAMSCNKSDSVTGTSVPDTVASAPVTAPVAPTAPAPAATPLPDGYWQKKVNFGPDGGLTIQGGNKLYEGEYCYFINGTHPQTRLVEGKTKVPAGHAGVYSAPKLVQLWSESNKNDTCEPIKVNIQADAGAFSFDCDNPSNQLADAGTNDLHAYKYFDIEIPAGKSPVEPYEAKERAETKWVEVKCPELATLADKPQEECYKCYEREVTIFWTDGCKDWEETKTETKKDTVTCPCVDEVVTTKRSPGRYCRKNPIGSESEEANWLGVDFKYFIAKHQKSGPCHTFLNDQDVVLFKDGSCDHPKGGKGQAYYVAINVKAGEKYCPFGGFVPSSFSASTDKVKDISHFSNFRGAKCPAE